MIPVSRDEILSRLAGIPAEFQILHKLHPGKCFIRAKRDPFFVLPGSRFARAKFSNTFASARLNGMKKLINTSV